MSNAASVPVSSEAVGKVLSLLRTDLRFRGQVKPGYVDVLGTPRAKPTPGERLFRIKALPLIYERFWRPVFGVYFFGRKLKAEQERDVVMEMLDVSAGDRVLDVGCGPGNYTRHLAAAAGEGLVVGADSSEVMINAAVKRGLTDNLAYVRADAENLPFDDGSFDVVSCVGVIHMMEDPMHALGELVRVLAPGGRMIVVTLCGRKSTPGGRKGVAMFSKDELPDALAERGLTGIAQRVIRRGQFVAARKPS